MSIERFLWGDAAETVTKIASGLCDECGEHLHPRIAKTELEDAARDGRENRLTAEVGRRPRLLLLAPKCPESFGLFGRIARALFCAEHFQ